MCSSDLGLDEMIARYTQAGERSFLSDALGSVIALAKEDQSLAASYDYSPYGQSRSSGAPEGNASQYTGRENDGTGLYYYRARYYDAVLKRFVSEDPIGLEGGINPFVYVESAPTMYSDPSGLVKHTTGRTIECGKGCTIRIDYTFDERTGVKTRHLH